ncbi:hypothetical protein MHYP_G00089930 [Metynnis hypsauchen]
MSPPPPSLRPSQPPSLVLECREGELKKQRPGAEMLKINERGYGGEQIFYSSVLSSEQSNGDDKDETELSSKQEMKTRGKIHHTVNIFNRGRSNVHL